MRRHHLLFNVLLGLLCSCSQTSKKVNEATANAPAKDSTIINLNSNSEKYYSVERGHYNGNGYSVVVKSAYLLTDTLKYDSSYYCQGNYLYLMDRTSKILDSIELAADCETGVIIQDVTQHLHFKSPLFNISSQGGSDTYTSEFIEYKNDSLQKLFEISDYNPVALEWKDEHTLTGFVKDRDEVVDNFEDYPVTVSLSDYSVKIGRPNKQEIGFSTIALANFEGYQIVDNLKSPYVVKKGTTVLIDSLNRKTNIVRLKIKDSIIIYVPVSKIKDKVQNNAAG